ncbi:MAG: GNAT family N-acetyltransferase [Actinobacteria bacterium]|nr:GNAT family N-acetyltransferase [Actinomycetota bacterium]
MTLAAYDAVGRVSDEYREVLADVAARRRGATAVLVAELDGEVVGSVTYATSDNEYFDYDPAQGDCGFRMLAVAPEAWGGGAGAALIDACVARARADGCWRMTIQSMEYMTRAHEMYLRRGFRRAAALDASWPSGCAYAFVLDLS